MRTYIVYINVYMKVAIYIKLYDAFLLHAI